MKKVALESEIDEILQAIVAKAKHPNSTCATQQWTINLLNLQGENLLDKVVLPVNDKAPAMRLPRDNVLHTIRFKLAEHVVELDWEVLFDSVRLRLSFRRGLVLDDLVIVYLLLCGVVMVVVGDRFLMVLHGSL